MRVFTSFFILAPGLLVGCRSNSGFPPLADAGPRCSERAVADVLTYHNDSERTGLYLTESCLTPASVNASQFGLLFVLPVDGKVDAQPLFMAGVNMGSQGVHDVLLVATEHDSVYAFDADGDASPAAAPLWQVSLIGPGESTSDSRGCGSITPEIGIAGTPVVDPSTSTLYVVAMTKSGTNYFQRLHALDVPTGLERPGSPVTIQASYPGSGLGNLGGQMVFDPSLYKERAGLLLSNGQVFTAWGSHCDHGSYSSFVISYDAATLQQTGVIDLVPNGWAGSIWMTGALAGDSEGNVYVVTGNGSFETTVDDAGFPSARDFGNAVVKLSSSDGGLAVADYFSPATGVVDSTDDLDLGSGGILLFPSAVGSPQAMHLMIAAGKNTNLYLIDRDAMGEFDPDQDAMVQEILGALDGGVWAVPAYDDGAVFYGDVGAPLKRFAFDGGMLSPLPTSQTATSFAFPGVFPSVSANGHASPDAIVWAVESNAQLSQAVLHAYLASDLSQELYNSDQAPNGRDHFGAGNKFIGPTIANGKVYVGTPDGVGVFGLF